MHGISERPQSWLDAREVSDRAGGRYFDDTSVCSGDRLRRHVQGWRCLMFCAQRGDRNGASCRIHWTRYPAEVPGATLDTVQVGERLTAVWLPYMIGLMAEIVQVLEEIAEQLLRMMTVACALDKLVQLLHTTARDCPNLGIKLLYP